MAKGPAFTTITAAFASASQLNANNDLTVTAFENTISRDGSTPNTMAADFDMDSNDIINVKAIDADTLVLGGTLVTAGELPAVSATHDLDTRTTIAATDVAAGFNFLRTSGYSAVGDGGEALYKRGSEPSHALKVQSNDGAWWELVPENGRVSVLQAGAKGDDSTDDATAINNTATFCKGDSEGGFTLVLPQLRYKVNSVLDFKEIRNIECPGEIRSSITSGSAVTIGTIINANSDMESGDIQLFVRSSLADNASLSGVIGIELKGAARCNFRLTSLGWDIGVAFRPDSGTGTQYIAFCDFTIAGDGNHVGLKFDSIGTAFINENTYRACQFHHANDALAGDSVGVYMTGAGSQNNNTFLTLTCEGQNVPIWIDKGKKNKFNNVRLETAGPIRFGTTGDASDKAIEDNTVLVNYIGNNPITHIEVDWFATRPNYVGSVDGEITWNAVATVSYDDFFVINNSVYSSKLVNSTDGRTRFASGILNDTDRTFDPGSNHRAQMEIPCELGDVFRIHFDRKTGTNLVMLALDGSKATLPNLTGGDTPYMGTNMGPGASALSGTSFAFGYDDVTFRNPWMVSINRSTQKFLQIQLRAAVTTKSVLVEKLMRGGVENDIPARQLPQMKTIADMSVVPDYPGQLAFIDEKRPLIGVDHSNWLQIGGHSMYAAASSAIAASGDTVNTVNKTLHLQIYDTTNNRIMIAQGSSDTADWISCDGGTTVTPS